MYMVVVHMLPSSWWVRLGLNVRNETLQRPVRRDLPTHQRRGGPVPTDQTQTATARPRGTSWLRSAGYETKVRDASYMAIARCRVASDAAAD